MQLFHCSFECFSDPLTLCVCVCVCACVCLCDGDAMWCQCETSPVSLISPTILLLPLSICLFVTPWVFLASCPQFQFLKNLNHCTSVDIVSAASDLLLVRLLHLSCSTPPCPACHFFCGISRKVSCPAGGIQTPTVLHLSLKLYPCMHQMLLAKLLLSSQSFICNIFYACKHPMNLQNKSLLSFFHVSALKNISIYEEAQRWKLITCSMPYFYCISNILHNLGRCPCKRCRLHHGNQSSNFQWLQIIRYFVEIDAWYSLKLFQ